MSLDRELLSSSESFKAQFNSMSKLLRTCLICEVVVFDDVRNLVDLQPVNLTKIGDEEFELPIINHVPVCYMGHKDLWITFWPEPGDRCIAIINDRSIDNWKLEGTIISPNADRHHDLADAVAFFGINPYEEAIADIEPETLHTRTRDGIHGIKVKDSEIIIHSDQSTVTVTPDFIELHTPTSTVAVEPEKITIDAAGASKIVLNSDGTIEVEAASVDVQAPIVNMSGVLNVTGVITGENFVSTGNGTNYNEHIHGDVENGAGVTGEPE